ncbi:MAG: glycosyltransferase family 2 protein [Elusimicrobia bacterium]|nr:glycosyltransferase family 2 protein [Elusimicrobiota bacterium]
MSETSPDAASPGLASPRVLVSVLMFNNSEDTIETISCLRSQTFSGFDLQVIDNASTNGCAQRVLARFPGLKVVRLSANLGYAGGNNVALEAGCKDGYDYVVICNHDIALAPDFLSTFLATARTRPSAALLGAVETDYATGAIRAAAGKGFDALSGCGRWTREVPKDAGPAPEVDYVQGALVLFSRKALLAGLRLDEKLFMYCEEIALFLSLRRLGLKACLAVDCRVRHKASHERFSPLQGYLIQRNRVYLCREYGSRLLYPLMLLSVALIELPIKIILRSLQGHPRFALACILGFADGVSGRMGPGRAAALLS